MIQPIRFYTGIKHDSQMLEQTLMVTQQRLVVQMQSQDKVQVQLQRQTQLIQQLQMLRYLLVDIQRQNLLLTREIYFMLKKEVQ